MDCVCVMHQLWLGSTSEVIEEYFESPIDCPETKLRLHDISQPNFISPSC